MRDQYPAATESQKEPTINERLNRATENLHDYCDRIESVLARINGTPTAKSPTTEVAKIRPTAHMAQAMESLESAKARLRDLTIGVERIA